MRRRAYHGREPPCPNRGLFRALPVWSQTMPGRTVGPVSKHASAIGPTATRKERPVLNLTDLNVRATEHLRRVDVVNRDGWLRSFTADERPKATPGVVLAVVARLLRRPALRNA